MALGPLVVVCRLMTVALTAWAAERPTWTTRPPEPAGGWSFFVGKALDRAAPTECREEALRDAALEAVLYVRHETREAFVSIRSAVQARVYEELRQSAAGRLQGARVVEWHEEKRRRWRLFHPEYEYGCWVLITYPESAAVEERRRLDALSSRDDEMVRVADQVSFTYPRHEEAVGVSRGGRTASMASWYLGLIGSSFGSGYANTRILEAAYYFGRTRIGVGAALYSRTSGDFQVAVRQSARLGGRGIGEERFSFDSAFPLQVVWVPFLRPYGGGGVCCVAVAQVYASYTGWASPIGHTISAGGEAGVPPAQLIDFGLMVHSGALFGIRGGMVSARLPAFEHRNYQYGGLSVRRAYVAAELAFGGMTLRKGDSK